MKNEQNNPSARNEHEKKNEGGREFGHVHEPSQTQQAGMKQGLAQDRTQESGHEQRAPGREQSSSGSRQNSSEDRRDSGSQQGRPPGNASHERGSDSGSDREKKSA